MTDDELELAILERFVAQQDRAQREDRERRNKCLRELDMRKVIRKITGQTGPNLEAAAQLWFRRLVRRWTRPGGSRYYFNTMPVLTFKVTAPEARIIRAKARAVRTSLSAYLRRAALGRDAGAKPAKIVRRRHPVSGLTYNAAPSRAVTEEEIHAALADVP